MHSPVALIPQLAGHIDRRRRQAAAADADARRGAALRLSRASATIRLAACVEFIHTATLLHDDVVDESALRRGQATANAVWGNKAERAGRRLPVRPRLPADGGGRLAARAATSSRDASAVIAEGEVLQLITANDTATSEDSLSRGHPRARPRRCSPPPAGSARWSPTGRRREEEALRRLRPAISASPSSWSTTCSTTAPSRRSSARPSATISARARSRCPCILAFRRGDDEERAFWRRTLEELRAGRRATSPRRIGLMERHGALRGHRRARAATTAPSPATRWASSPTAAEKRALLEVVDFCIERGLLGRRRAGGTAYTRTGTAFATHLRPGGISGYNPLPPVSECSSAW